jgi:hypothetical protein
LLATGLPAHIVESVSANTPALAESGRRSSVNGKLVFVSELSVEDDFIGG